MDLPLDIWHLILKAMATEGDSKGLFQVAQTSRAFAYFALPLLYEHYSEAGTSRMTRGRIVTQSMWWRSVIMSTIGQTYQPYYAFIMTLNLSNLYRRLERMDCQHDGTQLQDSFFSHPLQALKIKHGKRLDCEVIVVRVTKMFSDRLQKVGAIINGVVTPTASNGFNIPMVDFSHWPPRLTCLVADDEVNLTAEIALAIRKTCPRFKEVEVDDGHWIGFDEKTKLGPDQGVGEFISNLAPNSLGMYRNTLSHDSSSHIHFSVTKIPRRWRHRPWDAPRAERSYNIPSPSSSIRGPGGGWLEVPSSSRASH